MYTRKESSGSIAWVKTETSSQLPPHQVLASTTDSSDSGMTVVTTTAVRFARLVRSSLAGVLLAVVSLFVCPSVSCSSDRLRRSCSVSSTRHAGVGALALRLRRHYRALAVLATVLYVAPALARAAEYQGAMGSVRTLVLLVLHSSAATPVGG